MNDQDLAAYEAKASPDRADLAVLVAEVRRLKLILETKGERTDAPAAEHHDPDVATSAKRGFFDALRPHRDDEPR